MKDGNTRLRTEQKIVQMMVNLFHKLARCEDLVMDTCTGNMSVAKACLMLLCPRWFVGCAIDAECVKSDFPSLVLVFARQGLKRNS